ncbi:MAG: ankyrin repeat domain-containing protein [Vicinamibacterales bacterium]
MARPTARTAAGLFALAALAATAAISASSDARVADAASQGDVKAVSALLAGGADVNSAQGDGMTALHWAAMNGSAELTTVLLHAGANANAVTRVGSYTPLLLAAKLGHADVVDALLKSGASARAATANGTTALMLAAESGDVRSVDSLLAAGADPNAREATRGLTAAMFAAAAGRAEALTALHRRGADLSLASDALDLRVIDRSKFVGVLFGNPTQPKKPGAEAGSVEGGGGRNGGRGGRPDAAPAASTRIPGVDRDFSGNELVRTQGGMTPLLFATRQGHVAAVQALLDAGVDVNQVKDGDLTSPLLMATINGHYDLAKVLLDRGADPNRAALNGVAPLYAVLNLQWEPRASRPRLQAHQDQTLGYLDMLTLLLDRGADPNARLATKVWYSGGLSGVDETGSTAFWRAAYASDVAAMKLLVARGADPNIRTVKGISRPPTDDGQRDYQDVSGLPTIPNGGPGVPPLVAAAGVGYGEGFAANTHHYAPSGMMAAVKYLVEELGADVNAIDHEGNTALHNAAARGDVEMINYLVAKGADPTLINREGKSTADMANGPVQRIQPWPEALALLEKLGAVNHHRCVSC